jgi:hypothetical protein
MKTCFKCLCSKPLEAFYAHAAMSDGRLNKCKDCTRADVKRHRQENLERVRAYDKMRASMPHRVAARREYAQTPEGKASHARALKASAARYPEREKARQMTANAIRDGRLYRWPVCEMPECSGRPQAHHPDYSMPLVVVWLCSKHHAEAHALAKEAA